MAQKVESNPVMIDYIKTVDDTDRFHYMHGTWVDALEIPESMRCKGIPEKDKGTMIVVAPDRAFIRMLEAHGPIQGTTLWVLSAKTMVAMLHLRHWVWHSADSTGDHLLSVTRVEE